MAMKKAGSGWKSQGKSGPYMSLTIDLGALGQIKAMMFPNQKKTDGNQPDYNIVIATDEVKASGDRPKAPPSVGPPVSGAYKKPLIIPKARPVVTPQAVSEDKGGWPDTAGNAWDDGSPFPDREF